MSGRVSQSAVVYDEVRSAGELPVGCVDEQEAGSYRLKQTDGGNYFDYVVGPQALYSVVGTGTGCFELRLRFVRFPAPPYGRLARFCFDGATGAPTLLDIDRIEGSDRQVAVQVSGSVSDEDLTPPQDAAQ